MTETTLFRENFFILDDGRVRQFLFVSKDQALLIDTGFPDSHVLEAVRKITDAPVKVLLTHADWDHTGGLADFSDCYLHKADWHLVPDGIQLHPLKEGDTFSCGEYRLEALEIPGHTHGSVAFVDWDKKFLLPGDSVQKDGPIYLFGAHRDLQAYIESLEKLLKIRDRVEMILPCHHDCPIDNSFIEKNLQDAIALQKGELKGVKHPSMPCSVFQGQWTQFLF